MAVMRPTGIGRRALLAGLGGLALGAWPATAAARRWTRARAAAWDRAQPWLIGCNYVPAYAVNEIEMWQAFDPAAIGRELDLAAGIGMNTLRVFLHDRLWTEDARGLRRAVEAFLALTAARGMRPLLVLFDSCWDPYPRPGRQPDPVPGVHNSRWAQAPGARALEDPAQWPRLREYVLGIVGAFARDRRVLGWDVWNEPDNLNAGSYGQEEPPDKLARVLDLLPLAFEWARQAGAAQPLTSGLWAGGWSEPARLSPIQRLQLAHSDLVSFHCYEQPDGFARRVAALRRWGRPIVCTEYMARPLGSTVAAILPLAKRWHVGAYNWGLVAGRTQTIFPWDSWQRPYAAEPRPWFHDLFHPDGRPYSADEVALVRALAPNTERRLQR